MLSDLNKYKLATQILDYLFYNQPILALRFTTSAPGTLAPGGAYSPFLDKNYYLILALRFTASAPETGAPGGAYLPFLRSNFITTNYTVI